MRHPLVLRLIAAAGLAVSVACGPTVDLAESLEAAEVFTGWYDFGVVGGLNKLVPSVSFRLHNRGTAPVGDVQLTVSFWKQGDDGEWDSKEVLGIGNALAPGTSTDPILVRANIGFTTPGARADIFSNPVFQDVVAKVFAKRGGKIVPLGEHPVERRIIPHVSSLSSTRP